MLHWVCHLDGTFDVERSAQPHADHFSQLVCPTPPPPSNNQHMRVQGSARLCELHPAPPSTLAAHDTRMQTPQRGMTRAFKNSIDGMPE
eukprot:141272-Rhodomonas_salina.1